MLENLRIFQEHLVQTENDFLMVNVYGYICYIMIPLKAYLGNIMQISEEVNESSQDSNNVKVQCMSIGLFSHDETHILFICDSTS